MKKIILIGLLVMGCIAVGNAQQKCSEEFKKIEGFWNTLTIDNALNDPDKIAGDFDALKGNLTESIGKLNFKTSLPKFLPNNGKIKKGNLKKNKKRSYVTFLVPKDTMQITVSSEMELTDLSVMICSHDKQKMAQNLEDFSFANEEENLYEKTFYFTGIKGKVMSVALKNNGGDKIPFMLSFQPALDYPMDTYEEEYEEQYEDEKIETDDGQ